MLCNTDIHSLRSQCFGCVLHAFVFPFFQMVPMLSPPWSDPLDLVRWSTGCRTLQVHTHHTHTHTPNNLGINRTKYLMKGHMFIKKLHLYLSKLCACLSVFSAGMNQFGQMGLQSLGQRSTPLPLGTPLNQVSVFYVPHVKFKMCE